MDPPPSTAATATTTTKLRLMCSYGGHILPRPHNKSLHYSGGDTRIVSIDHLIITSLSSLIAHLSHTLHHSHPFLLKYQLPHHDLDSLVSVSTDEDLNNMLEEHHHAANSTPPSRIRLFLFPVRPDPIVSGLLDPKSDSWFSDALKSAGIVGKMGESGLDHGLMGFDSMPESVVLETSSSFESRSSLNSMSNLPAVAVNCEDGSGSVSLQDKKVKVGQPGSIESANKDVASAASVLTTGINQELASGVCSNAFDSDSIFCDPSSVTQMSRTVHISGYQLSHQSDQKQHPQQEVQYVQSPAHYLPQYPAGSIPISPYYPMYHQPLHLQQQGPYQPNKLYPFYAVPVSPSNMPMQCNFINTATIALGRPPLYPPTAMIPPPVVYKDATATPPIPESTVPDTIPADTPVFSVPSNQNQQSLSPPEACDSYQPVAVSSMALDNYDDEFDDLAYAQIYKTQPSAPALSPQFQTMTKEAAVLLSEASTKLQTHNVKQQV